MQLNSHAARALRVVDVYVSVLELKFTHWKKQPSQFI